MKWLTDELRPKHHTILDVQPRKITVDGNYLTVGKAYAENSTLRGSDA